MILDKTCLDSQKLFTANAILNIISEFDMFLWPALPLWQIKLPVLQRIHLVTMFSLGVLACVGGLLKGTWVQDFFLTWDTTGKFFCP
jgi:hypothetical protein